MTRHYVHTPDGQIHYRIEGSGAPILLLHQTFASSAEYSFMIPILAGSLRVVAMDTMGYGMSDRPPKSFTIEDYARTTRDFLHALQIKRTSILGSYTGASIAVEMAAVYPDIVDKLILSGCPYYDSGLAAARLNDPKFRPVQMTDDGSHLTKIWDLLRTAMPQGTPETWQRMILGALMAWPEYEAGHHAAFRYDMGSRLPLIKCPTLFVTDPDDPIHLRAKAASGLVADSTVLAIRGGSVVALEHPDVFARAVLDFLKSDCSRDRSSH